MNKIEGQWALVTGASSGTGSDFARALAERGINVVLAARRAEPMEKLADELREKHKVQVHVEVIDLARAASGRDLYQYGSVKPISDSNNFIVSVIAEYLRFCRKLKESRALRSCSSE